MICRECAREADGFSPNVAVCHHCQRDIGVSAVGVRFRPHKAWPSGPRCEGTGWTPHWGHYACVGDGCTCMHRPKGSWHG